MASLLSFLMIGLSVGIILGLTGSGGSILAMPLLTYFAGFAPHDSLVSAVTLVCFTAFIGVARRSILRAVHLKSALAIALGGIFTTPLGARVSFVISEHLLLILFGSLMIVFATYMLRRGRLMRLAQADGDLSLIEAPPAGGKVLTSMGLGAGFLSGLFGIGGGVIVVPVLHLFAHLPIRRAVATSLFITAFFTSISCMTHLLSHAVPPPMHLLPLFAGGYVGMTLGISFQRLLPADLLQKGVSVMILIFGAAILITELSK